MRIILIGFMGTGKTTVAKSLAKKTNLPRYELDELVEQTEGRRIVDIISMFGEEYFRKLESNAVLEVSNISNCIISTGGGCIFFHDNLKNLKRLSSKLIYLDTTFETISARLVYTGANRPLFKDKNKAFELYQKRASIYESSADCIISTENKSADIVADEIITFINTLDK